MVAYFYWIITGFWHWRWRFRRGRWRWILLWFSRNWPQCAKVFQTVDSVLHKGRWNCGQVSRYLQQVSDCENLISYRWHVEKSLLIYVSTPLPGIIHLNEFLIGHYIKYDIMRPIVINYSISSFVIVVLYTPIYRLTERKSVPMYKTVHAEW